jgi:hypothetical protein
MRRVASSPSTCAMRTSMRITSNGCSEASRLRSDAGLAPGGQFGTSRRYQCRRNRRNQDAGSRSSAGSMKGPREIGLDRELSVLGLPGAGTAVTGSGVTGGRATKVLLDARVEPVPCPPMVCCVDRLPGRPVNRVGCDPGCLFA